MTGIIYSNSKVIIIRFWLWIMICYIMLFLNDLLMKVMKVIIKFYQQNQSNHIRLLQSFSHLLCRFPWQMPSTLCPCPSSTEQSPLDPHGSPRGGNAPGPLPSPAAQPAAAVAQRSALPGGHTGPGVPLPQSWTPTHLSHRSAFQSHTTAL